MTGPTCSDKVALPAIALFLDVDGTLLEIAASPQAVSVSDDLRQRLEALSGPAAAALRSSADARSRISMRCLRR